MQEPEHENNHHVTEFQTKTTSTDNNSHPPRRAKTAPREQKTK